MQLARSCFTEAAGRHSGGIAAGWLLAAALALVWAPGHARSDGVIWQGNDQSVVLAPQDEDGAPPNDHPVTLAREDVEEMLASLRFRYADQEADAPPAAVFNREQVEILGEALAAGLTRAAPSQDVTFSVIGAHRVSPGALARRNRLTAGRAFFREGKLNLILGEIQSPYRKKNIYGRIEQDFSPRQYGSRTAAGEQESLLVASTFGSLHGSPGDTARRDWVVLDPDAAGREPASGSRPAGTPGSGEAAAPAAAERAAASGAPESHPPPPGASDIEQRLHTLKRLRDNELISEEAYRQKVDEILEDL